MNSPTFFIITTAKAQNIALQRDNTSPEYGKDVFN